MHPEWKVVFDELRAERDAARADAAAMRKSLDRLTETLAGQGDKLDQVIAMLRRREDQLKWADAELRKLRRKLGLPAEEPDPEDDPDPEPDAVLPPTPEAAPDTSLTEPAPRTPPADPSPRSDDESGSTADEAAPSEPRARPGAGGGRNPPPSHLESTVDHHTVCACSHCGGRVLSKDVEVSRKYDVVPSYVRCRLVRRERGMLEHAGRPPSTGWRPLPLSPSNGGVGCTRWGERGRANVSSSRRGRSLRSKGRPWPPS